MSGEKAIAIIPARAGSSRIPEKPLQKVGGKELVVLTCEAASGAVHVEHVVVATDDERIRDVVELAGFAAVMTSPDHATGTDRIAEAAEQFPENDVIINVQGDEPFLPPEALDTVAAEMLADPSLPMMTLAVPLDESERDDPNVVKVVTGLGGEALYFSRTAIPTRWNGGLAPGWMHVGIYAFRRETLRRFVSMPQTPLEKCEGLEQLRALENGIRMKVGFHPTPFHGIETMDDLDRARAAAKEDAAPSPGKERSL